MTTSRRIATLEQRMDNMFSTGKVVAVVGTKPPRYDVATGGEIGGGATFLAVDAFTPAGSPLGRIVFPEYEVGDRVLLARLGGQEAGGVFIMGGLPGEPKPRPSPVMVFPYSGQGRPIQMEIDGDPAQPLAVGVRIFGGGDWRLTIGPDGLEITRVRPLVDAGGDGTVAVRGWYFHDVPALALALGAEKVTGPYDQPRAFLVPHTHALPIVPIMPVRYIWRESA